MTADTTIRADLDTATLAVTWADVFVMNTRELSAVAMTLGWAVNAAEQVAQKKYSYAGDTATAPYLNVRVRRVSFASPLLIVVEVSDVALQATTGLAALIYVMKQVFKADLSIRTARLEQRARYEEAKRLAEEAAIGAPRVARPINNHGSPFALSVARRIARRHGFELSPIPLITPDERPKVDTMLNAPGFGAQVAAADAGLNPPGTITAVIDDQTAEHEAGL